MGKNIYVGNLSFSVGEAQLQELFGQKGTVDSVKVVRDAYTGKSRGFGFVNMAIEEEAQKAIEELNGYSLDERNLIVNEARPKPERRQGYPRSGRGNHRNSRW
jgi:RNA recognition motif-containing protein